MGITTILLFSAFFVLAYEQNDESYKSNLEQTREGVKIESREVNINPQNLRGKTSPEMNKNLENLKEKMKETEKKREDFKQKINKLKDNRKKDMADKIMSQINRLNQVWTNHFTNVLNRLEVVLQKIKSRAEKLSANNQDVLAINSAISKAETAISLARTEVLNQSKKEYVVDAFMITNETSTNSGQDNLVNMLRDRFKLLKDQLLKDLFALRDGVVKDARNAVYDAFKALSQTPNVDREPVENLNNQ
mgnify:FL=1